MVALIMSAMLLFVVPQFETIYADLGGSFRCRRSSCWRVERIAKFWWIFILLGIGA